MGGLTPRLALDSLSKLWAGHIPRQHAGAGCHVITITLQGTAQCWLSGLRFAVKPQPCPPSVPLTPQQPPTPCRPLPVCSSQRALRKSLPERKPQETKNSPWPDLVNTTASLVLPSKARSQPRERGCVNPAQQSVPGRWRLHRGNGDSRASADGHRALVVPRLSSRSREPAPGVQKGPGGQAIYSPALPTVPLMAGGTPWGADSMCKSWRLTKGGQMEREQQLGYASAIWLRSCSSSHGAAGHEATRVSDSAWLLQGYASARLWGATRANLASLVPRHDLCRHRGREGNVLSNCLFYSYRVCTNLHLHGYV